MAFSKSLPAHKEAQRLVSALYESTKKAPKELRFTLVNRLLSESVELVVDIDAANRVRNEKRVVRIEDAQRRQERLAVLVFVSMEQRCLSRGATAKAIEHIDNLGKQLHGWLNHTQNQLFGRPSPIEEPFT